MDRFDYGIWLREFKYHIAMAQEDESKNEMLKTYLYAAHKHIWDCYYRIGEFELLETSEHPWFTDQLTKLATFHVATTLVTNPDVNLEARDVKDERMIFRILGSRVNYGVAKEIIKKYYTVEEIDEILKQYYTIPQVDEIANNLKQEIADCVNTLKPKVEANKNSIEELKPKIQANTDALNTKVDNTTLDNYFTKTETNDLITPITQKNNQQDILINTNTTNIASNLTQINQLIEENKKQVNIVFEILDANTYKKGDQGYKDTQWYLCISETALGSETNDNSKWKQINYQTQTDLSNYYNKPEITDLLRPLETDLTNLRTKDSQQDTEISNNANSITNLESSVNNLNQLLENQQLENVLNNAALKNVENTFTTNQIFNNQIKVGNFYFQPESVGMRWTPHENNKWLYFGNPNSQKYFAGIDLNNRVQLQGVKIPTENLHASNKQYVDTKFNEVNATITTNTTNITNLQTRVDEVNTNLTTLETNLTTTNTTLTTQQASITNLETNAAIKNQSNNFTIAQNINTSDRDNMLKITTTSNQRKGLEFVSGTSVKAGFWNDNSSKDSKYWLEVISGELNVKSNSTLNLIANSKTVNLTNNGLQARMDVEFGTLIQMGHGGETIKFLPENNTTKTLQFYDAQPIDSKRLMLKVSNPTEDLHVANKQYVDTSIANIPATDLSNYYTKQEIDTSWETQNNNIQQNTTNIALKANDSEVVKLSGNQTIDGDKTLTNGISFGNTSKIVGNEENNIRFIPPSDNGWFYFGTPNDNKYFAGIDLNNRVNLTGIKNPVEALDAVNKAYLEQGYMKTEEVVALIRSFQTSPISPYVPNLKLNLYGSIFESGNTVGTNKEVSGTNLYTFQTGSGYIDWGGIASSWGESKPNEDFGSTFTNKSFFVPSTRALFSGDRCLRFNFGDNDFNNAISFSVKVKHQKNPFDYKQFVSFVSNASGNNWKNVPRVEWAQNRFIFYTPNGTNIGEFARVNIQEYNTFAMTIDGTRVKVYTNGVLTGSGTLPNEIGNIRNIFMFSSRGSSAYNSQACIKSIRVWNKVLSDGEIQFVYNMDKDL